MAGSSRSTPRSSERRSDEIRRRRAQRSRAANQQSSRQGKKTAAHTAPRTPPPVLARDPLVGAVLGNDKRRLKNKARRRYDVVLNSQGAEMRLPSLPQVRPGWRLASFALAAFLVYVLYQFWTAPMYRIETVEVSGLLRLSSNDVGAVLGAQGRQVFELDEEQMQQKVKDAFPEFSSVAVMIDFPQTVAVTVTERVPILAWRQAGNVELVDADGLSFPLREGTSDWGCVVIEAEDAPPPLQPSSLPLPLPALLNPDEEEEPVEEVSPFARAIPFLSSEMVSTILYLAEQAPQGSILTYSERHGLGWKDPREWIVYFGDIRDIPTKVLVYQAILDHLTAQDTWPALISVEYVYAPYYRLEP